MHFETVYYSSFWYSRFAHIPVRIIDGNFLRAEVARHLFSLRLLALFFDYIYIPRTHLLTQLTPRQWMLCDEVFRNSDAAFLRDAGILRLSVYPGLDDYSDTARILGRASRTTDVSYHSSPEYLCNIPQTDAFIVDSAREAADNVIAFPDYANWIEVASGSLSRELIDIIARAELDSIPFFHERFIVTLRSRLAKGPFEKVWRDTNSIYLITGFPNHQGIVPYFDERIESVGFRFEPHGIDRYLFNPASLLTFLASVLEPGEIRALKTVPIGRILEFDEGQRKVAHLFRQEYCRMVAHISAYTQPTFGSLDISQAAVAVWFARVLDGELDRHGVDLEDAFLDASEAVGDLTGLSVIGAATKPAAKYISRYARRRMRRRRYPRIFSYVDQLRSRLKGIA